MPVIGIDQVPRELQRPSILSDYGYGAGKNTRDALLIALQAILGGGGGGLGQVPTSPTPSNPGQLTFPSGAQTQTSPLEMAQIRQMGGVPTQQGGMTPLGPGGVTYQAPTRTGLLPNLERQKTQADIDLLKSQAEYWKSVVPRPEATPQPSPDEPPMPLPEDDEALVKAIKRMALDRNNPQSSEAVKWLRENGHL